VDDERFALPVLHYSHGVSYNKPNRLKKISENACIHNRGIDPGDGEGRMHKLFKL